MLLIWKLSFRTFQIETQHKQDKGKLNLTPTITIYMHSFIAFARKAQSNKMFLVNKISKNPGPVFKELLKFGLGM